MKKREILKNVFHLEFDNQVELGKTFLRFAEFLENPKFKGKIFSFEEFKKWYMVNSFKGRKTGRFTYYEIWDGFNMPSSNLKLFYQGRFDPLSKEEKKLLDAFKNKKEKFYIIGTAKGVSEATFKHEISHGLFNTNNEYKRQVLRILRETNSKDLDKLNRFLSNYGGGYHHKFWEEEGVCYLVDRRCLASNGVSGNEIKKISDKIKKIFINYGGLNI